MIDFYPNERIAGNVNSSVLSYDARNQALIAEWQQWASEATPTENRAEAVEELIRCLQANSKVLCLSNLGLISLPTHLPPFIEMLQVSDNQLNQLPPLTALPLKVIDVSGNRLTTLSNQLPPLLEELMINNNQISILPDQLPASLTLLNVYSNGLKTLSTQLPPALVYLFVGDNELESLPDTLPMGLKMLDVHRNKLNALPRLPAHLTTLTADNNQLKTLSFPLPTTLVDLNVSHNQLTLLSELPAGLQVLNIKDNQVEQLPVLPESLLCFNANDNRLVALPAHLPPFLEVLCVSYNALEYLPEYPPYSLRTFDFRGNPLGLFLASIQDKDIPLKRFLIDNQNDLQLLLPYFNVNAQLWAPIGQDTQLDKFILFLEKLKSSVNHQNSTALRERIGDWLCYLAKEENKALRTNTFLVAQEASGGCVDRTAFYFNKMYLLMLEDQLIKTKMPVVELFNTNLALFRLQQLEKIASQKAETRRGLSSGFAEELEIYLAYECLLREELSLPIYSELQHAAIAQLTDDDLTRAKQEIEQQEKAGFIGYLINESASWQARLTQWDRPQVESVEEAYLDFIGSDDFSQQVNEQLMKDKIDIRDADAHRTVSTEIAAKRLYQQRYQLTREFLAAQGQLALLDGFNSKREA